MNPAPIWINTGELSGDMHGAALLRALQQREPELRSVGMGGVHLAAAGMDTLFRIEDLSVMGVSEVMARLPQILGLLSAIKKSLAVVRPRALVVIDAPSFHFRLIRAARSLGIPVYYYISPKAWAWREKRAEFIKNNVRRLISILPFEVDFYRRFNMEIDYVGNPLVDMVDYQAIRHIRPVPGRIGLLPGSRKKEISSLLPQFGGAARILRAKLPHLHFACLRAPGFSEDYLRSYWPEDVPLELLEPGQRWQEMRRCEMLIAASGTVTLESAIAGVPTLAAYKVSPLTYLLARMMLRIRFISLANLILDRQIFPELLQKDCDAGPLAESALRWLLPPDGSRRLQGIRDELRELRERLGPPGAVGRAADIIIADLADLRKTEAAKGA
ncbi:lipid-A-disaccharide synthase [Desulfovibrio sp. OttesenSCG-928-A18]|nr:lipid-A-disaccharide synthase [Desulfovibrio sp. OttesenSCG-928-A18]